MKTLALHFASFASASYLALSAQSQTLPNHGGLIQSAIEHRWIDQGKASEFTYLEYWHNKNLDNLGHVTVDESAKFESISFGGEPFLHMIERNGVPLQGQDAKIEERDYDASIAEHSRRGIQERIAEIVARNVDLGLNLDLLPIYFQTTVVGLTKVNGRDAFEFFCKPRADIKPKTRADAFSTDFNVHVWIDSNALEFLQVEAQLLKDHNHMLPGTTALMNWAPVDGVWLPQQTIIRGTAKDRRSIIHFETEYEYGDYRKFHSSSRIVSSPVPVTPETSPSVTATPPN
jgi:hypothetical protein